MKRKFLEEHAAIVIASDFRCRIGAITVGGVILGKSSDERVPISPYTNVQTVPSPS